MVMPAYLGILEHFTRRITCKQVRSMLTWAVLFVHACVPWIGQRHHTPRNIDRALLRGFVLRPLRQSS
jgi:hypothetical protein